MHFNGAETTMVYHWTLGLVMREQNTKLITLITNLKSWIQSLPQTDAEAAQVISKL